MVLIRWQCIILPGFAAYIIWYLYVSWFLLGVDSFSNLSSDTNVAEWQSIVTPNLASSICLLLSNLVSLAPEDTLNCINKRGIFKSLLRYLHQNKYTYLSHC